MDDDDEAYADLLWRDAVPFSLRATDMTHNPGKQERALVSQHLCVARKIWQAERL